MRLVEWIALILKSQRVAIRKYVFLQHMKMYKATNPFFMIQKKKAYTHHLQHAPLSCKEEHQETRETE